MKTRFFVFFFCISFYLIGQSTKIDKVTAKITAKTNDDYEKAKLIHTWIANHIQYNYKLRNQTPLQTLRKRRGVCKDVSALFVAMCKSQNIPIVEVPGYAKTWDYLPGMPFYWEEHVWNAFEANGDWHLCDATWDMNKISKLKRIKYRKYKYTINDDCETTDSEGNRCKLNFPKIELHCFRREKPPIQWFDVKPESFMERHLPLYPAWQLSYFKMKLAVYERDTLDAIYPDSSAVYDYPQEIVKWQNTEERKRHLLNAETAFLENPHNHKALMEAQGVYAINVYQNDVFQAKMFRRTSYGYKMKAKYRKQGRVIIETVQAKTAETGLCLAYLDSCFLNANRTLRDVQREYTLKKQQGFKRHSFLLKASKKRLLLHQKVKAWNEKQFFYLRNNTLKTKIKNNYIITNYARKINANELRTIKTPPNAKTENAQNSLNKIETNRAKTETIKATLSAIVDSTQVSAKQLDFLLNEIKKTICILSQIMYPNIGFNSKTKSMVLANFLEGYPSQLMKKTDSLMKVYNQTFLKMKQQQQLYDTKSTSLLQLHLNNKNTYKQAKLFSAETAVTEGYQAEIEAANESLQQWKAQNDKRIAVFRMLIIDNRNINMLLANWKTGIEKEAKVESEIHNALLSSWAESYKGLNKHTRTWMKQSNVLRKYIRFLQRKKLRTR